MATVESPIVKSEATKVFLRPILSPKCPKSAEPMGRAKNASASVESDSRMATFLSLLSKNCVLNTKTAAVA